MAKVSDVTKFDYLIHWPLGNLDAILKMEVSICFTDWYLQAFNKTVLRWMSRDFTDDKSTLVRVMVWCRQATCHHLSQCWLSHYNSVIMGAMASQITNITIVYSTVYSAADQRKYQSSASLAFVRGIHRWPVNSPHKWPVTREMFPFDDVILVPCRHMVTLDHNEYWGLNNMVTIVRTTFSNAFLETKIQFHDVCVTEFCS